MTTLLLRAASAAAYTEGNGGATTISTSEMSCTILRNSLTYFTVSATVLYIFQLPAMMGVRIGRLQPVSRPAATYASRFRKHRDARQRGSAAARCRWKCA